MLKPTAPRFSSTMRDQRALVRGGRGLNAVQDQAANTRARRRRLPVGQDINIPHAYADCASTRLRQEDRLFHASILCVPVVNKNGKCIGVTQALNKRGARSPPRTRRASSFHRPGLHRPRERQALRRRAEHAELQPVRAQSMSSAVITLGETAASTPVTPPASHLQGREANVIGKPVPFSPVPTPGDRPLKPSMPTGAKANADDARSRCAARR